MPAPYSRTEYSTAAPEGLICPPIRPSGSRRLSRVCFVIRIYGSSVVIIAPTIRAPCRPPHQAVFANTASAPERRFSGVSNRSICPIISPSHSTHTARHAGTDTRTSSDRSSGTSPGTPPHGCCCRTDTPHPRCRSHRAKAGIGCPGPGDKIHSLVFLLHSSDGCQLVGVQLPVCRVSGRGGRAFPAALIQPFGGSGDVAASGVLPLV